MPSISINRAKEVEPDTAYHADHADHEDHVDHVDHVDHQDHVDRRLNAEHKKCCS
jgi:hypothetical protein